MKRSQINALLQEAKEFLAAHHFLLPPWAYWGAKDWQGKGESSAEIVNNLMGWDITDFGSGRFESRGLFLFTLRNGNLETADPKPYAEKIMVVKENQETPFHFHWHKMEDIINRGGGNLVLELFPSLPDDEMGQEPLTVKVDGIRRMIDAGGTVILHPGESICLERRVYHRFYGEAGHGTVLVGEVSQVNNDHTDNRFYEQVGRFPEIEEDVEPLHLLVNDYPRYL